MFVPMTSFRSGPVGRTVWLGGSRWSTFGRLAWFLNAATLAVAAPHFALAQSLHWTNPAPIKRGKQVLGCSAQLVNSERMTLSYVLDDGYIWRLDLSNPEWKFARGATFNVGLRVGNQYLSQTADAVDPETVRVSLQDSLTTFLALSWAWRVDLTAGAVRTRFPLAFGDRVLNDIVRCVSRYDAGSSLKRGMNVSMGTAPWQEQGQATESEMSGLSAKVYSFAGLTPAPLGDLSGLAKQLKPNAASRMGDFLVMMSVVPSDKASNPEAVAHAAVARDIKACRGAVFAGLSSLQKTSLGPAARAYSNCRLPNGGISVRYAIVPRKAGGYYLTSIIFNGPELVEGTEQSGSVLDQQLWTAMASVLSQ